MFSKCVFPHFQNLKAGEIPQPAFADDYNLGDIFLGVEYILQQRQENEDYYDLLTVSGMRSGSAWLRTEASVLGLGRGKRPQGPRQHPPPGPHVGHGWLGAAPAHPPAERGEPRPWGLRCCGSAG